MAEKPKRYYRKITGGLHDNFPMRTSAAYTMRLLFFLSKFGMSSQADVKHTQLYCYVEQLHSSNLNYGVEYE